MYNRTALWHIPEQPLWYWLWNLTRSFSTWRWAGMTKWRLTLPTTERGSNYSGTHADAWLSEDRQTDICVQTYFWPNIKNRGHTLLNVLMTIRSVCRVCGIPYACHFIMKSAKSYSHVLSGNSQNPECFQNHHQLHNHPPDLSEILSAVLRHWRANTAASLKELTCEWMD